MPWRQEALLQHRRAKNPICQCCGEEILTECYLDLEPFGILAVACETCVSRHTHYL